jgi:hypothetical protein
MKPIKKPLINGLIVFIILLILQCESKERFYRPDLQEQLCAVGLIDIDDTLSYDNSCPYADFSQLDTAASSRRIYFEKSIQSDYSDGSNDAFREFTFSISNGKEDMFTINSDHPVRNLNIEIPPGLKFESGRRYFFYAGEKEAPGITAECTVPELPPVPTLVSLKTGTKTMDMPKTGCFYYQIKRADHTYYDSWPFGPTYTRRFAEIEFSFTNINPESYYAIVLIGIPGYTKDFVLNPCRAPNFFNFDLLETNTDGFFYPFKGGMTIQPYCKRYPSGNDGLDCQINDTLNAYFIDGSKLPGGVCTLKIYAQWDFVKYIPSFMKSFRVRLLSMPKDVYLFYKSLYTYKLQADDPFSELVNINGNVVGGNGVIGLCRSRDLIVHTGQQGSGLDTFF